MAARPKWLLLSLALLTGCSASGFDRNNLLSRMQMDGNEVIDPDLLKAKSVRPQLHFPCRIAVYMKPSQDSAWKWDTKDKAVMETWAKTLREEGIASDVFALPNMLTGKGDMKDLRAAAINCGADALFVIHGAAQVDKYLNPASFFNLTVVGGYVVPGSHRDALFMMEGCLFDPTSNFVFAGVQSEGEAGIIRPTFIIEEKDAVIRAKAKALENFGPELLQRMRALASSASFAPAGGPPPGSQSVGRR